MQPISLSTHSGNGTIVADIELCHVDVCGEGLGHLGVTKTCHAVTASLWKSHEYGLDHLILAKLCGQLVRNHVSLERPVHKVHCHREFIPGQFTR